MSSVGVLKKKNLSVRRKKIFKVWRRRKKNASVEFRVFGKNEIGRKVPEKNQNVILMEI